MAARLQEEVEVKGIMHEAQTGFTRGRSCPGQIFALNTIIDYRMRRDEKMLCAYLDLRKAFDSVDRRILFKTMKTEGLRRA